MFKKNTTIRSILGNDSARNVFEDFGKLHLPTAEAIIIIWAKEGDLYIDADGFSEAEIVGSLNLMGHRVEHQGAPRR
jgi:hypothetical protein